MFFITFVHVLTHLNQPVTRRWVVKLYLKILSTLLVLIESRGASFSTETLDSSYAERFLRLALLQYNHSVAPVRWTQKHQTLWLVTNSRVRSFRYDSSSDKFISSFEQLVLMNTEQDRETVQ